jgi:phenylpyruvate tautomerase PptA (4-oxalocrotonate tautomerase family)
MPAATEQQKAAIAAALADLLALEGERLAAAAE